MLPHTLARPWSRTNSRPRHDVGLWTLPDGALAIIRPIRPSDEARLARCHARLSESSVHTRYFHWLSLSERTRHERLQRQCTVDPSREAVLVVERRAPSGDRSEIIAVGRLTGDQDAAEFALLVADEHQGQGLGTELLRRLIGLARARGLRRLMADVLPENGAMLRVCRRLGFATRHRPGDGVVRAVLDLTRPQGGS